MAKKVLIALSVVFIIIIILGGFLYNETYYDHYPKVRAQLAMRVDLHSSVSATGEIEFKDQNLIKTRVGGGALGVRVAEGEQVEKGQILLRLDTLKKRLEIKAAEIDLLETQKKHSSLLVDFKKELAILLGTRPEGLGNNLNLDGIDRDKIPRDFLISYESLERMRMSLELLQRELDTMTVRSSSAGTVVEVLVKEGDFVSPGTTLFEIADLNEVQVLSYIDAQDAPSLALGQKANIKGVAFPDGDYQGTVSFVGPTVEKVNGLRSVKVIIDFLEYRPFFRPGLPLEVTISTGIKDLTLTVPLEALHRLPPEQEDNPEFNLDFDNSDEIEEYVFTLEQPEEILTDLDLDERDRYIRDGVYVVRKIRVRTGQTSASGAEIKDTLEDGSPTELRHFDKVVIFSDRTLEDYDKVILLDRNQRIFAP